MTKSSIANSAENNRVRLTLDLSYRLNEIVDQIAVENDKSKAEVIRSAIEIMRAANQAKKDGMHVGAWSDSNKEGNRETREFVMAL